MNHHKKTLLFHTLWVFSSKPFSDSIAVRVPEKYTLTASATGIGMDN